MSVGRHPGTLRELLQRAWKIAHKRLLDSADEHPDAAAYWRMKLDRIEAAGVKRWKSGRRKKR